jgi:predicted methyltransferase
MTPLTKGQKTILKTLGMRELNRRAEPVMLPKTAQQRKPFDSLRQEGLISIDGQVVSLTEEGRDLSIVLMR